MIDYNDVNRQLNMKTRIVIVEDDHVWRHMLTRFLSQEADFEIVKSVETKVDAIDLCTNTSVDVVLMDINLTDNQLDGIQAILELSLLGNNAKFIAVTSMEDEQIIMDTFTAGAIHYVSKSDFRKLPELIRGILKSTSPQELLLKEYLRLKEFELFSKLTTAEKEIVDLFENGDGRAQIQEKLWKSESTLKNQISSILRKFNAKSMKQVITSIKSRGLADKELTK